MDRADLRYITLQNEESGPKEWLVNCWYDYTSIPPLGVLGKKDVMVTESFPAAVLTVPLLLVLLVAYLSRIWFKDTRLLGSLSLLLFAFGFYSWISYRLPENIAIFPLHIIPLMIELFVIFLNRKNLGMITLSLVIVAAQSILLYFHFRYTD